jgi:hypothetical protein
MPPYPTPPKDIGIPIREVVLGLIGVYNRSYWPAAAFGVVVAAAALAFVLVKPGAFSDLFVKIMLNVLWLWTGIIFFWGRFAPDFSVAYLFAFAFILQGTFFFLDAFFGTMEFRPFKSAPTLFIGFGLIVAIGVVHPVISGWLGRGWPELRLVGTAPGPTAAFTLAMLTFTLHKPKPLFFVIPGAWALVAGVAVVQSWRFYEELIPAGVAAVALVCFAVAMWRTSLVREPETAGGNTA